MTKTIEVSYDLPGPPAKVWRALTEPKLLGSWLMENDIKPEVGHHFMFRSKPMGDWDGRVACEVLEVVPHERLVYSWRGGSGKYVLDTTVTWTLAAKPDGGTRLRLEHAGFTDDNSMAFEMMGRGWRDKAGALAELSEM
jgi:uncharacterized protein YndB with AHSA1/START domain